MNIDENSIDKDIELIKCKEVTNCFIINESYKHLLNKELSLKDLNKYPLILQANGSVTRNFINNFTKENNLILKPNIELASYNLVVEFTKIGFGIGLATKEYIQKELDNKELFILNIKEKIPNKYIGIALSKNHLPNFSTKKLIEIITKK